MINKIEVIKPNKTIPVGFKLELDKMTVITGENNSGKTNFIQSVYDEKKKAYVKFLDENDNELVPEVIYIAAENIKPSNDECKFSAKTTNLIENLSKLFLNLGIKFKLENTNDIIAHLDNLEEKTNLNIADFAGHNKHKIKIDTNNEELDPRIIIQSLIKNIISNEEGKERELDNLGQGTQRIIVASILKAYVDILIEKAIITERPILILFEEPEIYLHPKLKRALNATLEKISGQPNHQIIVVTHDPYFAFQNFDGAHKNIYSFEKDINGMTKKSSSGIIYGIEDELLFTYLYSLLENKINIVGIKAINIDGFIKRDYICLNNSPTNKYSDLEYIRHQVHHLGDNPNTIGLIRNGDNIPPGKNYYTEDELSCAIKKMCENLI